MLNQTPANRIANETAMKTLNTFLLAAGITFTGLAGPLQKTHVAADAKWVIHLDVEALLETRIGKMLAREVIDPKLAKPTADLKQHLGIDFDWRRIRSVTLYGSDFSASRNFRGVVLVDTDMDLAHAFEAAQKKLAEVGGLKDGSLERSEEGPSVLYSLKKELYVATQKGAPVIVGKGREAVLKAREVLTGESPNLSKAAFGKFCEVGNGFFFIAAAEGFSEAAPVPPQARVLRMADGLRVVLGEKGDQVTANLALSAKAADTARQIHQVLQGMVALVALSQTENPDLQSLVGGAHVGLDNQTVTVDISLPVAKISQKIVEKERRKQTGN